MDAPIIDHLQDSPDVSPSFDNVGDKLLIEDPLDPSFVFSRDIEDKFVHFSSTPLFNLSNHEDTKEFIDFSDYGSSDPFTSIFYNNLDSIAIDLSKPPVYDDLSDDEVETPKIVEALQPEMISMSSPHSLGVSLTFDHETVQSPKAPHRSFICIEDPSHLHITLPPIKHNPIAHVLEDSYIASTHM